MDEHDFAEAHTWLQSGRTIVVSCAQKVCLSGDYGDMRDGGGSTFTASIRNRPKLRVRMLQSGSSRIFHAGRPFRSLERWDLVGSFISLLRSRAGSYEIDVVPTDLRNEGLGSSGAASVLFESALAIIDGDTPSQTELIGRAHAFEANLADFACGPQDHAASVYGGLNVIDFPDLSRRLTSHARLWESLSFWTTGERRDAHEIIPYVYSRHTEPIWSLKASLLREIEAAFRAGDVRTVVSCFVEEAKVQADLEMLTHRQQAVIADLQTAGAAAKVSGAGGGGVLVVAAQDAEARANGTEILRHHGLRELHLVVDEDGLRVESEESDHL